MDEAKILTIVCVVAVLFIAYLLCRKNDSTSFKNGKLGHPTGFLPLCSLRLGIPNVLRSSKFPSTVYPYVYTRLNGTNYTPCGISDVCSNGALCGSNGGDTVAVCSNNTKETCPGNLDWYKACDAEVMPGCDDNGENCTPVCMPPNPMTYLY